MSETRCPKCDSRMVRRTVDGRLWCIYCNIRSDGTTLEKVYERKNRRRRSKGRKPADLGAGAPDTS